MEPRIKRKNIVIHLILVAEVSVHDRPVHLNRSFTSFKVKYLPHRFYSMQSQNANAEWTPPDDKTVSTICPNEVVVAGVYLRLFVANPGWSVRRPKEFLTELMDFCLSLMSKEKTDVSCLFSVLAIVHPLCSSRLHFIMFVF